MNFNRTDFHCPRRRDGDERTRQKWLIFNVHDAQNVCFTIVPRVMTQENLKKGGLAMKMTENVCFTIETPY